MHMRYGIIDSGVGATLGGKQCRAGVGNGRDATRAVDCGQSAGPMLAQHLLYTHDARMLRI